MTKRQIYSIYLEAYRLGPEEERYLGPGGSPKAAAGMASPIMSCFQSRNEIQALLSKKCLQDVNLVDNI